MKTMKDHVKVSSPKRLSDDEFKQISGSTLYTKMLRNRLVFELKHINTIVRQELIRVLNKWLDDNCGHIHYLKYEPQRIDAYCYIYFESAAEAINCKLYFDGSDLPVVEKPKPVTKPVVPPYVMPTPSVSPKVDWDLYLEKIKKLGKKYDIEETTDMAWVNEMYNNIAKGGDY